MYARGHKCESCGVEFKDGDKVESNPVCKIKLWHNVVKLDRFK